jgi:hypothetical protein
MSPWTNRRPGVSGSQCGQRPIEIHAVYREAFGRAAARARRTRRPRRGRSSTEDWLAQQAGDVRRFAGVVLNVE